MSQNSPLRETMNLNFHPPNMTVLMTNSFPAHLAEILTMMSLLPITHQRIVPRRENQNLGKAVSKVKEKRAPRN
jgi:hypothetical protein